MVVVVLCSSGAAFAADTVTLEGMVEDQSIGYQGVSNLTNNTDGSSVNGLCVDENTYIYFGDTVPVTDGTIGVTNASYVKSLIVNNYRDDMTKQQGYDLQGAIWYFTDGKTPENAAQQTMVNNALADYNTYPDTYDYQYLVVTTKTGTQKTNNTELINTEISSNSVITYLGQEVVSNTVTEQIGQTIVKDIVINSIGQTIETTTETIVSKDKVCIKTTTTTTDYFEEITTITTTTYYTNTTTNNITDYYKNTTTTTTVNSYKDTIVTTDFYKSDKYFITFVFDSVQTLNKQDLILFTVDYWIDTIYWDNSKTEYNCWSNSSTDVTEKLFDEFSQKIINENFETVNVQTETNFFDIQSQVITWNCTPIANNTTTNPETVPMQDTGVPVALLGFAGLMTLAGIVIKR